MISLGYEVVPYHFDKEKWEKLRDIMMGLVANGPGGFIYDGFVQECETLLKPLKNNGMILRSGRVKRCFIDFALKYILNNGRKCKYLNGLRKKNPK